MNEDDVIHYDNEKVILKYCFDPEKGLSKIASFVPVSSGTIFRNGDYEVMEEIAQIYLVKDALDKRGLRSLIEIEEIMQDLEVDTSGKMVLTLRGKAVYKKHR